MPGPGSPSQTLLAPPEGIYNTFDDLLLSVQRVAKEQGYGVVKLRASNYRDGKPTRYDLVCDRGGAKYHSTAKKRTPSTRKIDCPWRAKAVCEVQLGYQWRFAVQEARHNHEARMPTTSPSHSHENGPLSHSIRLMSNRIDRFGNDFGGMLMRMNHLVETDLSAILIRMEQLLDSFGKRLDSLEARIAGHEQRFQNFDSRLQGVEARTGMGLPMDDVDTSRLLGDSVM